MTTCMTFKLIKFNNIDAMGSETKATGEFPADTHAAVELVFMAVT